MPPRSSSPICERSLDLTLIGIGRRDIPQCSPKHFLMQMFYRTFSGGQRPRRGAFTAETTKTIQAITSGTRVVSFIQIRMSVLEGSQVGPYIILSRLGE